MEAIMACESRCLPGILLVVLPTVMFGGVSILSLLIGDPAYMQNPLRQDLDTMSLHIRRYQTIEALTGSEIDGLPSLMIVRSQCTRS
jgi:hypothetical protein